MAAPIPLHTLHELQRIPTDDRSLVRLAQGPKLQHHPGPARTAQVEVGILRPNWLDGAKYLGQRGVDGFLCNVWEKVDFIWYYEDVVTKRPVHWEFYTGRNAHVMTFEVGAVLEDARWQAPVYCFEKKRDDGGSDPTAPSVTNQLFSRAFTGWST
ncbi:hypothetical protein CIPAW_05G100000 [Carya illinoinensis]|uniref:Uncharacterized protein n=1 Tax=Carya illinoinensis TaxID=32201 RepID=A0A8T1QHU8_CARIL|nr:hypothetical protein CIPAW_05G100000 [Carya illinoinensis]